MLKATAISSCRICCEVRLMSSRNPFSENPKTIHHFERFWIPLSAGQQAHGLMPDVWTIDRFSCEIPEHPLVRRRQSGAIWIDLTERLPLPLEILGLVIIAEDR